jgi:hypothetical protein
MVVVVVVLLLAVAQISQLFSLIQMYNCTKLNVQATAGKS